MKADEIKEYYKSKVNDHDFIFWDETIRQKETDLITNFLVQSFMFTKNLRTILDAGCGNGYTLNIVSKILPNDTFYGIDFVEGMIQESMKRNLGNCHFVCVDVCSMPFPSDGFDIVYSQRCIQNLPDWEQQKKAIDEIHRVLIPGGYYLLIESFTDGHENNNRAREECGLPPVKEAPFNHYLDKEKFFEYIKGKFIEPNQSNIQPNFLSSHYFIARVLHALVTKGEQKSNTEFVKFFSELCPPIGNYSPIQAYLLKKSKGD